MDVERLFARGAILRAMRAWFDRNGYTELQTDTLVSAAAMEEHLEPVRVGAGALHTSPEFAMKRALAAGMCRIYQVVPCFREEEAGQHHRREFTMLEWYRAGAGTPDLMDEVEDLVAACASGIGRPAPVFRRRAVADLLPPELPPEAWFHRWVSAVEPLLVDPTMVFGYPPWQAALARVRGPAADRFEVYLSGIELANAFAEETDGEEIRRRWERSNAARARAGRAPHPIDEAFLAAVSRMPRSAGIALGVDRLVMALTGATHIEQVRVA